MKYFETSVKIIGQYKNSQNFGLTYATSICPDKIFFVLDKMFFVPDKITFVPDKRFFVPDKNFCPRLKSSYLLVKRIENYFKLWKPFFP